jgi:ubiquinone/menaquinone biosynthesis C-methylase UbiE
MAVEQTLSREQARRFYDEFGARQDRQGWYEDPANAALVAKAGFEQSSSVLELGCGTGRLAATLLAERLPQHCKYLGLDASGTMCGLARARLKAWLPRADVLQTDGSMSLPCAPQSVDRVLTTYVLDLLSLTDIETFLGEAHRVLVPQGLLCAVGLTPGERGIARSVTGLWRYVHRKSPKSVGGCRPLELVQCLPPERWRVLHRKVVVAWGLASEVVIASPIDRS